MLTLAIKLGDLTFCETSFISKLANINIELAVSFILQDILQVCGAHPYCSWCKLLQVKTRSCQDFLDRTKEMSSFDTAQSGEFNLTIFN